MGAACSSGSSPVATANQAEPIANAAPVKSAATNNSPAQTPQSTTSSVTATSSPRNSDPQPVSTLAAGQQATPRTTTAAQKPTPTPAQAAAAAPAAGEGGPLPSPRSIDHRPSIHTAKKIQEVYVICPILLSQFNAALIS